MSKEKKGRYVAIEDHAVFNQTEMDRMDRLHCKCGGACCPIDFRVEPSDKAVYLWFTSKSGKESFGVLDANSTIELIVELQNALKKVIGCD